VCVCTRTHVRVCVFCSPYVSCRTAQKFTKMNFDQGGSVRLCSNCRHDADVGPLESEVKSFGEWQWLIITTIYSPTRTDVFYQCSVIVCQWQVTVKSLLSRPPLTVGCISVELTKSYKFICGQLSVTWPPLCPVTCTHFASRTIRFKLFWP
jgi:hypothetical protein